MAKGGRKNKYNTHIKPNFHIIKDMCRNGATENQIMKALDVGHDSWYRYKREQTEFSELLKENKMMVDSKVENELLERALGGEVREEKAIKIKETIYSESGRKLKDIEKIEIVEVKRDIPGDTTAQIFWLKNRRPRQWRDKQEIEHSGNIGNKDYKDMTEEELLEIAKERGIKV